jgi:hypothetical protein
MAGSAQDHNGNQDHQCTRGRLRAIFALRPAGKPGNP